MDPREEIERALKSELLRAEILDVLGSRRSVSSLFLMTTINSNAQWSEFQTELELMEAERLVILHRDTSGGMRHSARFGGITVISLRDPAI